MKVYIVVEGENFSPGQQIRAVTLDPIKAEAVKSLYQKEPRVELVDVVALDTDDVDLILSGYRCFTVRFSPDGEIFYASSDGELNPIFSNPIYELDNKEIIFNVLALDTDSAVQEAVVRREKYIAEKKECHTCL